MVEHEGPARRAQNQNLEAGDPGKGMADGDDVPYSADTTGQLGGHPTSADDTRDTMDTEIVTLFQGGATAPEIAAQTGVARPRIYAILERNGLIPRRGPMDSSLSALLLSFAVLLAACAH